MILAHIIGVPHHPEELSLIQQITVAAAPFAYALGRAIWQLWKGGN